MLYGTVIRMKNNDTFITQAMLASYLSVEEKDYLSLIIPFMLNCLPVEKETKIEVDEIQKALNDKYNLDILYNVVQKLLQKCCKQKNGSYVKRANGFYWLNKTYDSTKFDANRQKIKKSLDDVITNLQNYLINEKSLNGITSEKAQKYLSIFLDTYNYTIYENTECANSITINDKNAKTNYYVAQFILNEYNKESVLFTYIMEIIKGTLVAKSIYFFMYENNNTIKKEILGTNFYLDTRLLIEALGLNSLQEQNAMIELMKIVVENGGQLKTFNHYIEELKGILYKYVKDPECRLSLSLNKFNVEKYSSIDAKSYLDTVEMRIAELGIECEDKPDYTDNIDIQQWHIDYNELRDTLSASIEYGNTKGEYFSNSLLHDVDSIEAIAFYRGKHKKCSIMDCKSIFVTKNREIVNVIHKLYYKERFKMGEINFVITDIDLTAILWLSTFGKQNDLPKLKLLENVYAACAPSNAVMKAFLTKIKNMEENAKISEEVALLLRTKYSMIDDLVELTSNSSNNISENTIIEMHARLVNREKKQATIVAQEKLKNVTEKVEYEKELVTKEREDVEGKREDLIVLQRRISKDKQDNEVINRRIESQRIRNEADKIKNEKSLEHITKIKNRVIIKAKTKASMVSNSLKFLFNIIFFTGSLAIVFAFVSATYKLANLKIDNLVASYVIVGIVSVISLILTIYSLKKFAFRFTSGIAEKINAKIYSIDIDKNRDLFEE